MISLATIMALVRALHLAAILSLLGTAGFIAWMLPAVSVVPDLLRRRLIRLGWVSGLIAVLAGAVWFTIQSAVIAGAVSLSGVLDAVPLVARHTRYGNVMMARLGLLVLATALAAKSWVARPGPAATKGHGPGHLALYATLALTVVALALQGMIGHAGATEGAIGDGLVLSESLHLVAAGLWLGALFPLWLSLRALDPAQAAAVCERFSPIGLACVLILAGTGFVQGLELIGSVPALFGTPYGHIALLKIALFLLALVLAALNRLWLTDRLQAGAAGARRHLLVSVSFETCVGLAIVTAAAFMASSVPATHSAPVWPFSWRFSLITVNEDPAFGQEVIVSLIAIGATAALMVAALLVRRFRLIALAILVLAAVVRGPSLKLLTVEAYPTSFQTSPTGFAADSIVRGQALFSQNCVACHGINGNGNGPAAAGLRIKPANLTMPHLWEHSDGEMFWWLTHGIDDPESGPGGVLAMPGFGATLSADDRWALIDYIRAHNAGVAMQQDTAFDVPVRAPALPVTCNGVTASVMSDLRGHAVYVVAGEAAKIDVPPQDGITTVTLELGDNAAPLPGSCVAADPAAWKAYAVLADLPPNRLAGAGFLVDPNGWLRSVHQPGTAGGWQSRKDLIAAILNICTHPIRKPSGAEHEHHQ